MNNRLALLAAVGVLTAGLGIGTMTAGPAPPSAAGMSSLKLRDDPEQRTENRFQAEQRKPQPEARKQPGTFEGAAAASQGDSDDRRKRSSNNFGGDERDDDWSRLAAGAGAVPGGGGGDDDGGDDDGGDD